MGLAAPAEIGDASSRPALPGMDERIYFSRETGTWRFEDDDGNEMEYDTAKNTWVQVVRVPIAFVICHVLTK
jgi:HIV Tat-specific factor 1